MKKAVAVVLLGWVAGVGGAQADDAGFEAFQKYFYPVVRTSCVGCHSLDKNIQTPAQSQQFANLDPKRAYVEALQYLYVEDADVKDLDPDACNIPHFVWKYVNGHCNM